MGNKMKKKALLILTVAVLASFSLFGCGNGNNGSNSRTKGSSAYPTEPMILYANAPATYEELPKITPEELKEKIAGGENIIIVDVNPESMYNAGHLPGAVHRKWNSSGFTDYPDLPMSVLLVFYCVCANEEDSGSMALSAVKDFGYRNIMLLLGGSPAWEEAGFPMESS